MVRPRWVLAACLCSNHYDGYCMMGCHNVIRPDYVLSTNDHYDFRSAALNRTAQLENTILIWSSECAFHLPPLLPPSPFRAPALGGCLPQLLLFFSCHFVSWGS